MLSEAQEKFMFIIFFLVLEVFQVFHFLHLAAVHGWPPAANFTLEIKSSSCNAVVFTISIFTALQEFFNILFIRIMLKNTCKAAKICVFPFLFLTIGIPFLQNTESAYPMCGKRYGKTFES